MYAVEMATTSTAADDGASNRGGRGGREDSGSSSKWAAFDAAFRGKTTVATVSDTDGRGRPAITSPLLMEKAGTEEEDNKDADDQRSDPEIDAGTGEDACRQPSFVTTSMAAGWSPLAPGGGTKMRRWADQCRSDTSCSHSSTSPRSGSSVGNVFVGGSSSADEGLAWLTPRNEIVRGCPPSLGSGANQYTQGAVVAGCHGRVEEGQYLQGKKVRPGVSPKQVQHHMHPTVRREQRHLLLPLNDINVSGNGGVSAHHEECPQFNRWFTSCVLLHGCLCEAPLAVVEGIVRAPLYLVASACIAIVGYIGTSTREHRSQMLAEAAALTREGVLFLAASLSLAVPCSTTFSIYRSMDPDNAWDVRPVPTVVGAVDPLRFFVFAFGQAGELAANGQPELLPTPRRSYSTAAEIALALPRHTDGLGLEAVEAGGEGDTGIGGRRGLLMDARRFRLSSSLGVVAAQSMDTDRLGVGMLHPPHEVRQMGRRANASVRRTAATIYRRCSTHITRMMSDSSNTS